MNLHNVTMLPMQFDSIDKRVFKYDIKHHMVIMAWTSETTDEGHEYYNADCVLIESPVAISHDIIIDRLVKMQYPDGEDLALLRKGCMDAQNAKFIEFNENVEAIKLFVKSIDLD